ncbi:hypothetical protein B0T25DRAFT_452449 [Lasiosphaeria hispida]|uniref:WD-like domain-containing protein n=1 Tax=Lasiosphaeria hispida TaxID=260671 RepID=A0AAJ0HKK1_9PEZI|nr:hypothetical protein B0T25DRAFT_452449 [Lasiosphaeria hispida]
MLTLKAVIFAGILPLGYTATVDVHALNLEPVRTERVGNGTLSWFAAPPSNGGVAYDLVSRDPGCGTNNIKCATSNAYHGPTCQNVINVLDSSNVADGYRAVCLDQGNGQCCISWSKNTSRRIRQNELVPSARRSLNTCGDSNKSGQEWNVNLGGTCLSQCLSNRPTGCK